MGSLWVLLKDETNQRTLGWLGAGVGLWTAFAAFVYFFPHKEVGSIITETCGSIAVSGSVSGSTVKSDTCSITPPDDKGHTHVGSGGSKRDVYFNKPEVLYYEEPEEIKLVVEAKKLNETEIELKFDDLNGKVIRKTANIGAFVTASLSAPRSLIEITARDDRVQKVGGNEELIFAWFVTPLKIGNIPIRLDLTSQDNASKDAPVNTVQVMQEKWTANARGMSWVKYQIVEFQPIGVAICGVGAAVASALGFFGLRLFGDKTKSDTGADIGSR